MSGDAAAAVGQTAGSSKTPADFLKSIRGRPVVVKLNSGVDYRGMLGFSLMQITVTVFYLDLFLEVFKGELMCWQLIDFLLFKFCYP